MGSAGGISSIGGRRFADLAAIGAGREWLWGIESFGRLFRATIDRAMALPGFAASRDRRWLRGISAARLAVG